MFCPARPYFLSPDSPFQNPPAIGSYWLVPHILVLLSAEKENESRLFFWILLSVLLCQLCSILQTCLSSKMGMFPFATKPCQCHFHTGRVRTAANKENMQNSCRTQHEISFTETKNSSFTRFENTSCSSYQVAGWEQV